MFHMYKYLLAILIIQRLPNICSHFVIKHSTNSQISYLRYIFVVTFVNIPKSQKVQLHRERPLHPIAILWHWTWNWFQSLYLDLPSVANTGMMVWLVMSSYGAQNILFCALVQAHNTALRAIRALHCDTVYNNKIKSSPKSRTYNFVPEKTLNGMKRK